MLEVRGVCVTFDEPALVDVDLTVAEGEVVAVLGPSGCGKSTLLRVITGLQRADAGSVSWRGSPMGTVAVHQRPFGLMFQDYALFPHLDVGANVAFGLRDHADPHSRAAEVLALVGLADMADRSIDDLSGGEQQRVALARALAPAPELLLLDEPVGSLDRNLREELVAEVDRIVRGFAITTIYVTHDQDESLAIADRIVVMNEGRVVQSDTPAALWRAPANSFVARFLGMPNIVAGTVVVDEVSGRRGVATSLGFFPLVPDHPTGHRDGFADGEHVDVLIPDSAVTLGDASGQPATVRRVRFGGGRHRVDIEVAGVDLTLDLSGSAPPGFAPVAGATSAIRVDPDLVHVMPRSAV